jgi:formylglycine-generating enzyme required for sulfatase activity
MARVFISYRRRDSAALATLLAKELSRRGIRAFVDTRQIDGGGPFPSRLLRAIEEADVLVCLLGPSTLDSEWVREEITHANKLGRVLIPVFQEMYVPPQTVADEHVAALLQSDGVHILDVRNIFVDQAINDLTKMIRHSAPRRLSLLGAAIGILLVILATAGIAAAFSSGIFAPSPEVEATTPAAIVDTEEPTVTDTPLPPPSDTATITPTPTNSPTPTPTATRLTPSPTATATLTPTTAQTPESAATLTPLEHAHTFTGGNDDWMPVERDFDRVTMVLVPVGCFLMGSADAASSAQLVHEQCFNEPFWIDKYEVTNRQFALLRGQAGRPSFWTGLDRPRERIDWFEARDFCQLRGARLPTEAEWEYAARGPDSWNYPWGDQRNDNNAVWRGNANEETADVGSRPAGASWVGALDMSGNVAEWTSSLPAPYPYDASTHEDPDDTTSLRVLRGGSWFDPNVLLAQRTTDGPARWWQTSGFRCVRDYDADS